MTAVNGYFRLYSRWVIFLKRRSFLFLGWALLLLTGVSGCGFEKRKAAEYPTTWPSRITSISRADCLDISGTYKTTNRPPLLPFLLFGITNEASSDWANLIQVYKERLLADPDGTTVTIGSPDPEHIEVIVAIHGMPVAKQLLTRSYQSANILEWFGQHKLSCRCEPDSVVTNSSFIHDWDVYSLLTRKRKVAIEECSVPWGPWAFLRDIFISQKLPKVVCSHFSLARRLSSQCY
jgi:hypothetical protein